MTYSSRNLICRRCCRQARHPYGGRTIIIVYAVMLICASTLLTILHRNFRRTDSTAAPCSAPISDRDRPDRNRSNTSPVAAGATSSTASAATGCDVVGRPCDDYPDDVELRVIVLTQRRPTSLLKLLRSLDRLELDGDRAALEIWIDRCRRTGAVDRATTVAARSFRWTRGPTRVHVQWRHVGIYGQWIDTWRPRFESPEIGLILEDDISVSPFAYRWLKAVHRMYAGRPDYVGATLTSDQMTTLSTRRTGVLAAPKNDTVLMYKSLGTWGFSPKPDQWRRFQDWYHQHKPSVNPFFHPYVANALPTKWYKLFETDGTADTMWEIWFIYFMHVEQLYTVYSNLGVYTGKNESCLCINRREVGLHVDVKGSEKLCRLLTVWNADFVAFPREIVRLDWDGTPLVDRRY